MERVLLTTMVWVISIIVSFAAPVSEQAAMLAAQKFLRQQMPAMSRGESRGLTRAFTGLADGEEVGIYVFNATNGYVVVSADDNLPEILAYGNGEPFDAAKAPADMKAMLEAYYHAATSQVFTRANVQTHDDIAPFITTKWNQLEPYNALCPAKLGEGVCPTGCVATAMAQVMYYYQYPANYEWDKMKTAYSKTDSGEAVDAVAQLMADCGSACFMDYSVDGSGTSDIYACEALRYDFGYSETTEYVKRECYTAESWDALIYNEISAKRPVMYGALSASSGQGVSGHEFILDGYEVKNGIGYYHVNWGWGGNSDDYFLLSVLNPDYQYTGGNSGSSGYSFSQSAIVGIMPTDQPKDKTTRAYLYTISIEDDLGTYTRQSITEDFPALNIELGIYNIMKPEIERDYDIAVALYNGRNLVSIFDQGSLKDVVGQSLDYSHGVRLKCDSIVLGHDLSDGEYQIRVLCRESGTTEWTWAIESLCRYVQLTVDGKTMNTAAYGKEVEADTCDFTINSVECSESPRVGKAMTIKINLTDKNKTGNSPIFLWGSASVFLGKDNYQLLTGGGTNLDPGETGEVILEYTPQRSGTFNFVLSGSRDNCDKPLYTFNVEVRAVSIANVEISAEIFVDGAEKQLDGTNKVVGSVLKGVIKLTNNGTEIYEDDINIVLYDSPDGKSFSPQKYQTLSASIEKDKTIDVAFNFADININQYYAIVVYAVERGEAKALNLSEDRLSSSSIFFLSGGETDIDRVFINNRNADVYDLRGNKIGKLCNFQNLPVGVYIINHRKVFKGNRKE